MAEADASAFRKTIIVHFRGVSVRLSIWPTAHLRACHVMRDAGLASGKVRSDEHGERVSDIWTLEARGQPIPPMEGLPADCDEFTMRGRADEGRA